MRNGILMNKTFHAYFDAYKFTIFLQENKFYFHAAHNATPDVMEYNGKEIVFARTLMTERSSTLSGTENTSRNPHAKFLEHHNMIFKYKDMKGNGEKDDCSSEEEDDLIETLGDEKDIEKLRQKADEDWLSEIQQVTAA